MDSITHSLLGACTGELIAGRIIGRKAMLFGALINNIPDIDNICYLWMRPDAALLAHRGITHSLFFNLLLTFLLAFSFRKIFKGYPISAGQWLLLVGLNLFLHLFPDLFNAYGIGIFEPFSSERYSLNALFIIDPFFTLPLLVAAVLLLILRNGKPARRKACIAALALSSCYLLISLVNKPITDRITEKSISSAGISPTGYFTSPTPFNNLLWYVVAKDDDYFYTGYYSLLDDDSIIHFERINKNDSLLDPFRNREDIRNLLHFSGGYYCAAEQNGSVVLNIIRFEQQDGWRKANAPFNFSYDVREDQGDPFLLQRGRIRSFSRESISGLISRIIKDL